MKASKFLLGIAGGGGAIWGLFAPDKGTETRRKISKRATIWQTPERQFQSFR
jgi:gas vesicle protein